MERKTEPQIFLEVELEQIKDLIRDYKDRGWRFTNLCASDVEGRVELLYSFSSGRDMENLRVLVDNGQAAPAVSPFFPNAFLHENETRDLYGVKFDGITLDYNGRFYPTSVPTPMNPSSLEAVEFLNKKNAAAEDGAAQSRGSKEIAKESGPAALSADEPKTPTDVEGEV